MENEAARPGSPGADAPFSPEPEASREVEATSSDVVVLEVPDQESAPGSAPEGNPALDDAVLTVPEQAPDPAADAASVPADEPDVSPAADVVVLEVPEQAAAPDADAAFVPSDEPDVSPAADVVVLEVPEQEAASDADAAFVPSDEPAAEEQTLDEILATKEQQSGEDTEEARLLAILEAAVYITDEPLAADQIARALNRPLPEVRILLDKLVAEYNKPEHGLTVKEVAGGYKMATKPEHHEAVRTFVKNLNPPLKLSLAALETLAVIAYKQPITAPEIMEIRGVQGAGVLKTLLDRKLIGTAGRKNVVGKPILYKTTREFLVQFGLKDLAELPTLKEFEDLRRMAFSDAEDEPAPPEIDAPAEADPAPEPEPESTSNE